LLLSFSPLFFSLCPYPHSVHLQNFAINGPSIASVPSTPTTDLCCDLCSCTDGCVAFSLFPDKGGRCELKASTSVAVAAGVQTGLLTNPVLDCSSWEDLTKGIAACATPICNFALAKGFTTPSTGFKSIDIKGPVHISIDGEGVAVIDAHGKWGWIVV
jgi:hypothetical protein